MRSVDQLRLSDFVIPGTTQLVTFPPIASLPQSVLKNAVVVQINDLRRTAAISTYASYVQGGAETVAALAVEVVSPDEVHEINNLEDMSTSLPLAQLQELRRMCVNAQSDHISLLRAKWGIPHGPHSEAKRGRNQLVNRIVIDDVDAGRSLNENSPPAHFDVQEFAVRMHLLSGETRYFTLLSLQTQINMNTTFVWIKDIESVTIWLQKQQSEGGTCPWRDTSWPQRFRDGYLPRLTALFRGDERAVQMPPNAYTIAYLQTPSWKSNCISLCGSSYIDDGIISWACVKIMEENALLSPSLDAARATTGEAARATIGVATRARSQSMGVGAAAAASDRSIMGP